MRFHYVLFFGLAASVVHGENFGRHRAAEELSGGKGCMISWVRPSSPAEAAGLQPGDIVLEAEGTAIHDVTDLQRVIAATGSELHLMIRRAQENESVIAHLGTEQTGPRLGIQCAPVPESAPPSPEGALLAPPTTGVQNMAQPEPPPRRPSTGPVDAFFQDLHYNDRIIVTFKDGMVLHGIFAGYAEEGARVRIKSRHFIFLFRRTYLIDDIREATRA